MAICLQDHNPHQLTNSNKMKLCYCCSHKHRPIKKGYFSKFLIPYSIRLFVFVFIFSELTSSKKIEYSHQRLVRDILENYDPRVRPVADPKRAVNVSFRMELYQIVAVKEASQCLSLYMWINEAWQDEFIFWRPDDYNKQHEVVVKADAVWRPDTYLYNSIDMGAGTRITSAKITMSQPEPVPYHYIKPRATVKLQYPAILTFSCNLFLLYFPFDTQNCSLEFASWVYDLNGIDYEPESRHVHMDSYIQSSEWEVLTFESRRIVKKYKCCPTPYVSLHYHLIIKRKPLFYVLNLIIPTLIICIIAMVGFFFPSHTSGEREQKVSLGISTLLSMSVFLLMVSDDLPTTSDFVPYIGWFYIGMIVFIAAATLITSLFIVVQQQGRYGRQIPRWLRRFVFEKMTKLIILRAPASLRKTRRKKSHHGHQTNLINDRGALLNGAESIAMTGGINTDMPAPNGTMTLNEMQNSVYNRIPTSPSGNRPIGISASSAAAAGAATTTATGSNTLPNVMPELAGLTADIAELHRITAESDRRKQLELEWEWLASVLEQWTLGMFLTALAIFAYFIMNSHPQMDKAMLERQEMMMYNGG